MRDSKVDLCAITETGLNVEDAAVRAKFCPEGYKFWTILVLVVAVVGMAY
jgi:hypothetical protein